MAPTNTLLPAAASAQRGTALIEFTLVLPLLLVMTVAAVDFGRAFFVKNVVSQAAREGVRLARRCRPPPTAPWSATGCSRWRTPPT